MKWMGLFLVIASIVLEIMFAYTLTQQTLSNGFLCGAIFATGLMLLGDYK
jgi:hypothetical protein